MDDEKIRILMQYIDALEDSYIRLEKSYIDKDMPEFQKVKKFMVEVKIKIDSLLK